MPVLGVMGGRGASHTMPSRAVRDTFGTSSTTASLHACPYRPGTVGSKFAGGDPPIRPQTNNRARSFQANLCPIRRRQPLVCEPPPPPFPCSQLHRHTEILLNLQRKRTREKTTTDGDGRREQRTWQFKGHLLPVGNSKATPAGFKTKANCLAIQRPRTYNCQLKPAKEGAG